MTITKRFGLSTAALAAIALAALCSQGLAQSSYPDRPITLIVPFAAGGSADALARHVSEAMSRNLGQRIVIENVGGAGGTIGSARAARAAPDGYTILLGHSGTHAAAVSLYKKLPYDPITDYEMVGILGDQPQFLMVKNSLPIRSFSEFVAYTKANKHMTYGTAGVGSAMHLGGLLLNSALGTDLKAVSYRGGGPAMTDFVAGHLDFLIDVSATALPQIRAGAVTPLAVFRSDRVDAAPTVPGAKDLALPGLDSSIWIIFMAPKGTPRPVVMKLNQSLRTALDDPSVKQRMVELGVESPEESKRSPEGLTAYVRSEIERWKPILEKSGVSLD